MGVSVGNRAPTNGGTTERTPAQLKKHDVFAKSDDIVGFQARCANAQNQDVRVCHSHVSPSIGSTRGTNP